MSVNCQDNPASPAKPPNRPAADWLLAAVCALVIGVYAWCANSGVIELRCGKASETYYNLLIRGFSAGHLNLARETPPGLSQLRDPYDPAANNPYRWALAGPLHDTSFYKGKLYLYFGVTPALLLFWPWHALTGRFLLHQAAVTVFCGIGFLASMLLLRDLWRRYFPDVRLGVVAGGTIALGLATGLPILLARSDVYEVPISCGYAMAMLALLTLWRAWHGGPRSNLWLAAASLAYGLAIGARPTLLFGAVFLLGPAFAAWRAGPRTVLRKSVWMPLLAATVPLTLVGVGLMLYNYERFGSPFDFGHARQLTNLQPIGVHFFSPRYLWFNLKAYFIVPSQLGEQFPFVQNTLPGGMPPGHYEIEDWFGGVAFCMPLAWLALCAPLALRGTSRDDCPILRAFLVVLTILFAASVLILSLYFCVVTRYLAELLPPVALLAVAGIFALERIFAANRSLIWIRSGWLSLLGISVAFNLLASVERRAQVHFAYGDFLRRSGRPDEALVQIQRGLKLSPGHKEVQNAISGLLASQQELANLREAVRLHPGDATLGAQLASALLQSGRSDEAVDQLKRVLQLQPGSPQAHNDLGVALLKKGDIDEAIFEFYQALRLAPGTAGVRNNVDHLLSWLLHEKDAVARLQRVVERIPESDQAQYALGVTLQRERNFAAAILHYQKALDLEPRNLAAQNSLAWLLATCGDPSLRNGTRSLPLARQVDQRLGGQSPQALDTLAAALAETGQFDDAVATARRACQLAAAQTNQTLFSALQKRIELYQAHSHYHEGP